MWQALQSIARGTTLYYKQLNFFVALAVVGLGGFFFYGQFSDSQLVPQAAELLSSRLAVDGEPQSQVVKVNLSGRVTVADRRLGRALTFRSGEAVLLIVAVRDAPVYIPILTTRVLLPRPVPNLQATLKPRIYAIHGTDPANTSVRIVDNQTVDFVAADVDQGSTVSFELRFPDGYFTLALLPRLQSLAANLTLPIWSVLVVALPAFAGVFLAGLLAARWWAIERVRTAKSLAAPPNHTPPAIIGALYRGKIGRTEVAATLFDLAARGFISFHFDATANAIDFAKGGKLFTQGANDLRPFEIFLLHQIFGPTRVVSHGASIERGLNDTLFSNHIAMTIVNVYDAAVAEGYFVHSPNRYYLGFRTVGISLFFVALAILGYEALIGSTPNFSLLSWVGMLLASLVIIWVTPGLPPRGKNGDTELRQWVAFRNYLARAEPITATTSSTEFFAYLPYALVLDCAHEWVRRWRSETLVSPAWLSSDVELYRAEDYTQTLVKMVSALANRLIAVRPPDLA